MKKRKRLSLKMPKGVDTGSRLRLAGKGEGGQKGGPSGDLYVVIRVKPHPVFKRRDDDLFCEVPVPVETLILGGNIQAATIDGYARLKIAAGTQSGKVFRLRNKGMPSVEGYGRGDLHVKVVAEIPVKLSSSQKKTLQAFGEDCSDANYPVARQFKEQAETFFERREAMNSK